MKSLKNVTGFSLIEMVIVLFVITILCAIAYPTFDTFHTNRKTEFFLSSFQRDLLQMQQRAITEGTPYRLNIDNENHFYEIQGLHSGSPVKRSIPEHITFESHSIHLVIQYNRWGNIGRGGTLFIHTSNQTYKMVFQIGKGKFYVAKQ